MKNISQIRKFDGGNVVSLLQEMRAEMNGGKGELVLDFSDVLQLDTNALRALEQFATHAEQKETRVVLRGVKVDVYKVLTLVKLTSRFSFVS